MNNRIIALLLAFFSLPSYAMLKHQNKTELNEKLIFALKNRNIAQVAQLLEKGADPNTEIKEGVPVLREAIYKKYPQKIIELLIKAGANPNQRSGILGNPILNHTILWADRTDKPAILQMLLKAGANPNLKNEAHYTALTQLFFHPMLPEVDWDKERIKNLATILLEAKADPNIPDDQGYSALMMATGKGYKDIVEMLLKAAANPNVQATKDGNTALILAAMNGDKDIAGLLLKAGARVDLINKKGKTALDLAKTPEIKKFIESKITVPALADVALPVAAKRIKEEPTLLPTLPVELQEKIKKALELK